MAGKCRPSLLPKTLENVMRSNLSKTDKECIKAVFDKHRPNGRWMVENEDSIRCSECCFNRATIKMPMDYCPLCGADMGDE